VESLGDGFIDETKQDFSEIQESKDNEEEDSVDNQKQQFCEPACAQQGDADEFDDTEAGDDAAQISRL
jgi:hypothetical protein